MKDNISTYINNGRNVVNISWRKLERLINELALYIKKKKYKFDCIYGLPRNGLVIAVMLSYKLNIPVVTSLADKRWFDILVVDDIEETSNTIRKFKCYHLSHKIYVLFCKTQKPLCDKFIEKVSIHKWIHMPFENKEIRNEKNNF